MEGLGIYFGEPPARASPCVGVKGACTARRKTAAHMYVHSYARLNRHVCVCRYIGLFSCVCTGDFGSCALAFAFDTDTHMYTYIYIYIYAHTSMCLYVNIHTYAFYLYAVYCIITARVPSILLLRGGRTGSQLWQLRKTHITHLLLPRSRRGSNSSARGTPHARAVWS